MRLLTEHWDEPKTLSEISRETEIHKATCAALLGRLVTHGFIRRTPGKSYMLGPALVDMAFRYARRFPGFTQARREIFGLAERTGLIASICVPDGEEMVILDATGDVQRVGQRLPFAPPLGNIFKAWSSPEEIEEWFSQIASEYDVSLDQQVSVVSAIRSRGYSLGSEHDFDLRLDAVMRRLRRNDTDLAGISVALMLADRIRTYSPGRDGTDATSADFIVGPVFDHRGDVVMSITLVGAPGEISTSKIEPIASELLAATRRITTSIGGTPPHNTPSDL
jgi:DNA-binding IclR family transcriptional regulator